MLNTYAEHMKNLSIIVTATSSYYVKFTQLVRVSDNQDIFMLPTWIHGKSLVLVSHQNDIF